MCELKEKLLYFYSQIILITNKCVYLWGTVPLLKPSHQIGITTLVPCSTLVFLPPHCFLHSACFLSEQLLKTQFHQHRTSL